MASRTDKDVGQAPSPAPVRPLPRPFSFHWGGGQIVEEATFAGEWNEPTIQLLEYENGGLSLRFCSYNHRGMFLRSPLMMGEDEIKSMKQTLDSCPRIKALLKGMVS